MPGAVNAETSGGAPAEPLGSSKTKPQQGHHTGLYDLFQPTSKRTSVSAPSSTAPATAATSIRPPIPRWSRSVGLAIIGIQLIWAIAIPVKNVVMIASPMFRADTIETETSAYGFDPRISATTTDADQVAQRLSGTAIVPILRRVMEITMSKRTVREILEDAGAFDLDRIHQVLTADEFQVIMEYYALVFQATEFPATVMIPQRQHFSSTPGEVPTDAIGMWIVPKNGSSPWMLSVSCAEEHAKLDGMQCFQGSTNYVCYDFPVAGEVRRQEKVSLDPFRVDSGLANPIALTYIIETFHAIMNVQSTKSWKKTLQSLQYLANDASNLTNGFSTLFHEGIPIVNEGVAIEYSVRLEDLQTRAVESCFTTQLVADAFYFKAFVLQMIESYLQSSNQYDPSLTSLLGPLPQARIDAMVSQALASDFVITSGARPGKEVTHNGMRIFGDVDLTVVRHATASIKSDKTLGNTDGFGSSHRMLIFAAFYPGYYSHYDHHVEGSGTTRHDVMVYRMLGSGTSGLNTFKSDWYANTMEVFRLAEIPRVPSSPRLDTWWDEEAVYAKWFQALEASSDAPFYALAKYIDIDGGVAVLDDDSKTRCHRAFYKTLTKILWLSLLSTSQLANYLVFMGYVNGGAYQWFLGMSKRNMLNGELLTGSRHGFAYSESYEYRKDDGSAWVMVPLLQTMLQAYGRNSTIDMFLKEFNATFPVLVSTEYGHVHFPDSGQCLIGFKTNNISASDNNMAKITAKFYPSVVDFINLAIDNHADLHEKMRRAMAERGIEMVSIPTEAILDSPSAIRSAPFMGSPVFWRPNAFSVGMQKVWPAVTPPPATIELYRNSTVCYRTLELRYLNESIRCWVEPGSFTRSRVEYNSERLRYITWSNWSISLVLNLIAILIAVQFMWRFVVAYRHTGFRCVSMWVGMQLNFQGFGVLSFPQIILMTLSTVPLMLAYHMPTDDVFMPRSPIQSMPKALRDGIVTLSSTWFIRIGYEVTNHFVVINEIHDWLSNFQLRMVAILVVYALRLAAPDHMTNGSYEMWKLLCTCLLSMVLGAFCAILPILHRRHVHRVQPSGSARAKSRSFHKEQNVVVAELQKNDMALNHHGLLGFSVHGWSLTALIVEGWEVAARRHKNDHIVFRGRCKIRLREEPSGELQCLL